MQLYVFVSNPTSDSWDYCGQVPFHEVPKVGDTVTIGSPTRRVAFVVAPSTAAGWKGPAILSHVFAV